MTLNASLDTTQNGQPDPQLAQEAIELAARLLRSAQAAQTSSEKAQAGKIAGMMTDTNGKMLTIALSDQAFRSHDPARIADQIRYLLDQYGVPQYFSWWERAALRWGAETARFLPSLVVPLIVARLRQETQNVILPSEEDAFKRYLRTRRGDQTRLNINQLGEAILGEGEARRRLDAYLGLLARPDVEYISVKISSVFSRINLVAFDETVGAIKVRLRELYRSAMQHTFTTPDGRQVPKFVNLDMEEYRDLHLTVAAFKDVLSEDEFKSYRAGLVLQAYLPDSSPVQRDLTTWAQERVQQGGAPIKVRVVKGANFAMEQVEASWHGWELAPYRTKTEVDANFKRMVTYGCVPERAQAVNLGIASHNLFDVAYGLLLQERYGLHDTVEFEMLEGMANHQARAVQDKANGLLLYAPIVKREDFHSAIAYLVRRLDENTAEENFLHDLFDLDVGGPAWEKQKNLFLDAYEQMHTVGDAPQRQQDRNTEQITFDPDAPFHNEPDTDFSLRQNSRWVSDIRDAWRDKLENNAVEDIPLQIGGQFISGERMGEGNDPSRPHESAYRYALATPQQVEQALSVALEAQPDWAAKSIRERKTLLVKAAEIMANRRGDFLGAMMLDGGKRPYESDPEISEGIDFANYYARSLDIADTVLADCEFEPLGVMVITPPWNFPFAIPAGGALAALMAGNSVIFKPAPEAVLVGWHIMQALWDAGIPKDVLQFVPTTDDEVGKKLITDERVGGVILTGAYETATLFKSWRPDLRLYAETSGKNAMIITAMADHDQAIKDLVKSAFGHAGQKCSAASLAILEAEVYDNPTFMRQLRDAASSMTVGAAWQLASDVTPLIRTPNEKLHRALTRLEPGESWLLEPRQIDGNPHLWSPGIKLGVQPGSFFHKTECFGPVLGLMRADNLDQAIDYANAVDYGLTAGLQSLDEREITHYSAKIQAGNIYINRVTTGAIVQRQSFGGWKKSVFGNGKTGAPNYVLSMGTWHDASERSDAALLQVAREDFPKWWRDYFSQEHDPSQVLGEANIFRYRPLDGVMLRVEDNADALKAQIVMLAAQVCGVHLTISIPEGVYLDTSGYGRITTYIEDEQGLIDGLATSKAERLRVLHPASEALQRAATAAHVHIVDAPVLANGRLELRHYLKEQAISHTTHRYGNILQQPV